MKKPSSCEGVFTAVVVFVVCLFIIDNFRQSSTTTNAPPSPSAHRQQATNSSNANYDRLRALYAVQSAARQQLLGGYLSGKNANFGAFYNALVPEVVCSGLARVGNVNDGGKWTCNPWALPDGCVIYSLGVGPDITFETAMDDVTNHRCHIYSFDPNTQLGRPLEALKNDRITFRPWKIATATNETLSVYTVQDLMRKLNHSFIDFFKIDIEGSEFSTFPPLLTKAYRSLACQIFVEMHGTPSQCATLHVQLSRAGFHLFSYEINGFYHQLAEYSFVHESCFERFGITGDHVLSRNFPLN